MFRRYVPEAGDMVWLPFEPQAGDEQAGHWPALGVCPSAHNGETGLMLCCAVATQSKGYPCYVPFAGDRRELFAPLRGRTKLVRPVQFLWPHCRR